MIRYFSELEKRDNYYITLIDVDDKGKREVLDYKIPLNFFEKYSDIFKNGDFLINVFENFDIDQWLKVNFYSDYEKACDISLEFESIKEELYGIIEDYNKINACSRDIEYYLYILKRISFLFIDLIPNNKELYISYNEKIKEALKDLEKFKIITYEPNKVDNIYQPDAWYITPNGYLYNAGKYGHKSRDLTFNYRNIVYDVFNNKNNFDNHKISNYYFNTAVDIKNNGYITADQFKLFLNYISKPLYLENVNGIPITREKNINQLVLGIVNAQGCLYEFFEDLCIYTSNPTSEINKIIEMTNNDIGDILVRCCGFHKIESTQSKTITTSLINYETAFSEYINNGWNIQFIPPIIINKEEKIIEEYNSDFILIRKILKK
jgi:hypothetical protein